MSTSDSVPNDSPVVNGDVDVNAPPAAVDSLDAESVAVEALMKSVAENTSNAAAATETTTKNPVGKAASASSETYVPRDQHKLVKRPPGGGSSSRSKSACPQHRSVFFG
ncbi:kynurenine formamidase, putative [Babesia ovata]|uniref:Kynurenine formamidase, putative n=1 Tax=Babesia ovata TaxID=189622 RepID=A0A2H6KHU8_9APIC|nr:kynurenine formamidase, putative [Babesia ovata]GBE62572.1 kynurenine formamidase, putative [Babesia ovata]